jgi:hypothetical protein
VSAEAVRRAGADTVLEPPEELRRSGAELRLANVQPQALDVLRRAGMTDQVAVAAAR